ncbi:hypothetical protein [Burkholderia cenocepacia]|uniref:hypothetical protein n=1 Tax=Burkholderia cenocepacia TaxID=95486 RepID=UPI002012E0CE|nr:hypothetical protein [Burkholderia cenocepacia]
MTSLVGALAGKRVFQRDRLGLRFHDDAVKMFGRDLRARERLRQFRLLRLRFLQPIHDRLRHAHRRQRLRQVLDFLFALGDLRPYLPDRFRRIPHFRRKVPARRRVDVRLRLV